MSFNETDLVLSYGRSLGKLDLSAGFIYYGTNYVAETQEIYAAVSYAIFGRPTLAVYRDIGAYPGTYFLLSIGQSFPLTKRVTLDAGSQWNRMESTFTGQKGIRRLLFGRRRLLAHLSAERGRLYGEDLSGPPRRDGQGRIDVPARKKPRTPSGRSVRFSALRGRRPDRRRSFIQHQWGSRRRLGLRSGLDLGILN